MNNVLGDIHHLPAQCQEKLNVKAFEAALEQRKFFYERAGKIDPNPGNVTVLNFNLAKLGGVKLCQACIGKDHRKKCSLDSGIELLNSNTEKDKNGEAILEYGTYGATK